MNTLETELAQFLQRCAFPDRAYAEDFEPSPIYRAQATSLSSNGEAAIQLLLILRKLFGGPAHA